MDKWKDSELEKMKVGGRAEIFLSFVFFWVAFSEPKTKLVACTVNFLFFEEGRFSQCLIKALLPYQHTGADYLHTFMYIDECLALPHSTIPLFYEY